MSKYIDADRLKLEVEKHIEEVKDAGKRLTPNMGFFDAKLSGIYDVMDIIDSLQQEQPEGYFFCKFGGMLPKCADCARNHANSPYDAKDIDTWMRPGTLGTKQCSDYIRKDESELDNPGTEFVLNDVKSKK